MTFGHDTLAAARYINKAIKSLEANQAVSVLLNSFDEGKRRGWRAVKEYARSGKYPLIKVVSLWSDNHRFSRRQVDLMVEDFRKMNRVARRFPHIKWQFNPFLEYDQNHMSKAELMTVLNSLRDMRQADISLVNNPMAMRGRVIRESDIVNELHHEDFVPKNCRYAFSYDGNDCVNANIERDKDIHWGAEVFWWWSPPYNLKKTLTDSTKRPDRRSSVLTRDYLKSIQYLANEKSDDVNLPRSYVWKSHAEIHSDRPAKSRSEGRPVFLSEPGFRNVVLKNADGKIVGRLYSTGQLHDGRYVYRLPAWGYEKGNRAFNKTGKRTLSVVGDGKILGVVDPGFRENQWKS